MLSAKTARKNVTTNSLLLGTLFLLVFPVDVVVRSHHVLIAPQLFVGY
jgi:hypothetical protein